MRLASNPQRVADLRNNNSIRAAIEVLTDHKPAAEAPAAPIGEEPGQIAQEQLPIKSIMAALRANPLWEVGRAAEPASESDPGLTPQEVEEAAAWTAAAERRWMLESLGLAWLHARSAGISDDEFVAMLHTVWPETRAEDEATAVDNAALPPN